ncbi:MAG TPA: alpha/beta hydrolase [Kofleriaceae bacterium]|nr:alpha/beta hydrolase [Kofleriaceae bacterium]
MAPLLICVCLVLHGCGPSFTMRIATAYVSATRPPYRTPDQLRHDYRTREYPVAAPVKRSLAKRVAVRETTIAGSRVFTLTPKTNASSWHIVYLHGGCFVNELDVPHWDMVEALIDATGATVVVPVYPLAPEHTASRTFAMLDALYAELSTRVGAEHVVLSGDSAGGNLALVATLRARANGQPLPARIILFSPWVDLTLSNPQVKRLQLDEPMLRWWDMVEQGRWWAGDTERRDPYLSPVFADLRGLPPVDIYQGTRDILWPDSRVLRDRIQSVGGRVTLYETDGGFHDFMAATVTPEAKAVYRQIRRDLGGR